MSRFRWSALPTCCCRIAPAWLRWKRPTVAMRSSSPHLTRWRGALPLRLVSPHGAGSGADILSRLVGPKLAERWKVTTITDNRTGASGDIGIVAAAGAEPDGYTLLCVATVFTINPFMKKNPPYNAQKSFAPVSLLATSVLSFLVPSNLP